MKLHVPDILHILETKPILLSSGIIGTEKFADKHDKIRQRLLGPIVPMIHKAEKFIFDSGQDQDMRTVTAVRETAVNMLEAGLFHLPHKAVWIEDPFSDGPNDTMRNFYLVTESDTQIMIQFFQRFDYFRGTGTAKPKNFPELVFHVHPLIIDLTKPDDKFLLPSADKVDEANAKVLGEAVYSVKKLVVALNTRDIVIERVQFEKMRTGGDHRRRQYPHSIIRVPFETGEASEGGTGGIVKRRRKHLVRGFVWGKNTRPIEQQRWVNPYWRGDNEVGVVLTKHYEVG